MTSKQYNHHAALTERLDAKDRQLRIMLADAEIAGGTLDESRYDAIEDEWVAMFIEREEAAARISAARPLQKSSGSFWSSQIRQHRGREGPVSAGPFRLSTPRQPPALREISVWFGPDCDSAEAAE